jgi:hypothetical protein
MRLDPVGLGSELFHKKRQVVTVDFDSKKAVLCL